MIPQAFIQDLLARVDIVDVVGRAVTLKKAGRNYLGLCPFHGEKTPSFTVSPSKQFFHCFGCGAHGSAISFLMDHRNLGYVEAVHELAQMAGVAVPSEPVRDGRAAGMRQSLLEANEVACAFYRRELKQSAPAIEYLKSRGVTGVTAARFALGFAPDQWQALAGAFDSYQDARLVEAGLVIEAEGKRYDRFRGRLMFPIRDRRSNVIGFGARVLDDSQPKYLNSPETPLFHKGQELYGLFEGGEAVRKKSRVLVCEGYLDVIQLAQAGFEESVAALGTAITPHHVSALLKLTDTVVFAFDGDDAGRNAARRALQATLAVIPDTKTVRFALLPQGEDPDSLVRAFGAAAFETQLSRALSLSQWFLKSLCEQIDVSAPEGRAAATAAARPLLESMPPGGLRMQLVRALAEVVGAAAADLEALYGLAPARRLPGAAAGAGATAARPSSARPVESLKAQLLRRLLAFPELAREFAPALNAFLADRSDQVDRQIAEVLAAACAHPRASCAALLEALAESEFAQQYRTLRARDLQLDDDVEAVREELRDGVLAIEEARVRLELSALEQLELSEQVRERSRALLRRLADLKHQRGAGLARP
ncbi:MAG: DNA primase [Burkholderiaceae bacterium]|nr:DNA primase [Burkholderiaceae bacterium]